MPDFSPDDIAALIIEHSEQLPRKRKPAVRDNGVHEWVPMSGIAAEGTDITDLKLQSIC
jgi:tRNA-specific adenosine deaminase 1